MRRDQSILMIIVRNKMQIKCLFHLTCAFIHFKYLKASEIVGGGSAHSHVPG